MLKELQNANLTAFILAGLLLTLLILVFIIYFVITYRRKQRDYEELRQKKIQIQQQHEQLSQTLRELKAAQHQLIHAEKMASLGELTAGIAHEMQNPLNFVNNFSELSVELTQELKIAVANQNLTEIQELSNYLFDNLVRIKEHGSRASNIIKGMLQHSRNSSGERAPTDINSLVDEYLQLSYHGHRVKDKTMSVKIETQFDEKAGRPMLAPQEFGRVLLNLFTNAYYALQQKYTSLQQKGETFEPKISVGTQRNNHEIRISITDNGSGIPNELLDKIFQPFFTTKPVGQGTGLGLSISYDIITKGHQGKLEVFNNASEGNGTKFVITLFDEK